MTRTNNFILTIFGVKNDGKTTLGLYYLEKLNKPSIIIDITEQFEPTRKYHKLIKGVAALRYELMNESNLKLFKKGKFQIIFRPLTSDIRKEVEEVVQTILDKNVQHINIFFDEIETYANNRMGEKSSLFKLFYISRNRNINIISVVKVMGMLSPIIKTQTDYFAVSQINELNSEKYFNDRSKGQIKEHLKDMKAHEFLVTDLSKYWRKIKLDPRTIKILENKRKKAK